MISISLEGKRALVTGGSRGIGRSIAIMLARAGASVGVGYRGDEAAARDVVETIVAAKGRAIALRADLRRWSGAEELTESFVKQLGALDILVVNHGIWKRSLIHSMTEQDWDEMADINLKATVALCRFATPYMQRNQSGSIVLISSTAGQRGEPEHSHYAATKGAVISLTKSLAPELAPFGIRVNCVAPGWVETEMTRSAIATEGDEIRRLVPLKRVGQPDEIAGAVLYLVSDLSTFVLGEVLNVNGGAVLIG
jgi:3-oxoacyl-[acyl-carrier protein] reductase